MISGVAEIKRERKRQVTEERYGLLHDDKHNHNELAFAAVAYALPDSHRDYWVGHVDKYRRPHWWPWNPQSFKATPNNRIRELVKAGALIAAEIDRLKREAKRAKATG